MYTYYTVVATFFTGHGKYLLINTNYQKFISLRQGRKNNLDT